MKQRRAYKETRRSPGSYDSFAWFYNRCWAPGAARRSMIALRKLIAGLDGRVRVLDLCCGTGQLAASLCATGNIVTGIDVSAEMLRFARENAPDARFVLGDARDFELSDQFDVVLSMFDSLNHVLAAGQLKRVFTRVHRVLKPGGVFVFDLNMEEGYRERWKGQFAIVEDDHLCVVRANYDERRRLGTFEAAMFREMLGHWRRSDVILRQRAYTASQILKLLHDSGFESVSVSEAPDIGRSARAARGRSFFVARN